MTTRKYPPTHILSPRFKYTPASQTDIAATFARIRAELAARDTAAVPMKRRAG